MRHSVRQLYVSGSPTFGRQWGLRLLEFHKSEGPEASISGIARKAGPGASSVAQPMAKALVPNSSILAYFKALMAAPV